MQLATGLSRSGRYHPVAFLDDNTSLARQHDQRPRSVPGARVADAGQRRRGCGGLPCIAFADAPPAPGDPENHRAAEPAGADRSGLRRHPRRPRKGRGRARRRCRRPARARPGAAECATVGRLHPRQGRDGHRRGRLDRLGAVPADHPAAARAAAAVRDVRARAVQHRSRAADPDRLGGPDGRRRAAARRRASQAPRARDPAGVRRADDLSRGRVQARADRRAERDRGHLQQHLQHLERRRGRARVAGRDVRADLDRQGREPDQRHGCDQALRRDRAAGSAGARRAHALLHGALRQRARILGLGRAAVPRADPQGRAGDGHAQGRHPLLHDHPGSGAAGAAGGLDGARAATCSCSTWASRCASPTSPSA